MEIIVAIVVVALGAALYFNRKKPAAPETVTEVPYKVEVTAPQPAPVVVETTPVVEAAPVVAEPVVAAKTKKPAAPKKTTASKAPAKKPAAKKPAPKKAAK